ncbi:MAG: IS66 family insertion sequence element accessory protein TnpA [Oliverpabstia sp.]
MNINEEMKLHKWAQDMAEQQNSGLSQTQWCKMKGIPATTFQYRCRKVRMVMEEKLQENNSGNAAIVSADRSVKPVNDPEPELFFAKVDLSPEHHTASGINIKFQDTLINIAPDAHADHVKMVLEVLAHAQ